jgi:prepilin-type N-terminal cleavage/methylation domain-containing protein
MPRRPHAVRQASLLVAEEGFTLIEVLIATVIMVVGIMAVVTTFESSRNLTTVDAKQESATHRGERELESIIARPYDNIALTAAPSHSGTSDSDPGFFVTSASPPKYQWDRSDASKLESFCSGSTAPCDGSAGALTPGPQPWTAAGDSGSLYRFVTWVDDQCGNCTATTDYKRVTVALTVNGPNAPKKPIYISTIVSDPQAGPGAPP